jgi:hypothetical protein
LWCSIRRRIGIDFDGLGERPVRTLEDGQRGFQLQRGRESGVVEKVTERLEGAAGEFAELVTEGFAGFAAGVEDGGSEVGLMTEPVVDGGAVDAGFFGRGGDGLAAGQGRDYL